MKNYLIIDLEATCDDKGIVPRDEMETIEIGAVLVDAKTLAIVDKKSFFIKPVRHPILTPFCTGLTTIKQTDVDNALGFAEVIQKLEEWLHGYEYCFCSWGFYDKKQLLRDCEYHGVKFPLGENHLNIKKLFSEKQKLKKPLGLGKALKYLNLSFKGQQHRGIDDAYNMACIMSYII